MAFDYRTEYSLGKIGRVRRSYVGGKALVAIALDLALGSAFGLVGLGWWLVRAAIVTAWRLAAGLVGLTLGAARAVDAACSGRRVAKPAWASMDEV